MVGRRAVRREYKRLFSGTGVDHIPKQEGRHTSGSYRPYQGRTIWLTKKGSRVVEKNYPGKSFGNAYTDYMRDVGADWNDPRGSGKMKSWRKESYPDGDHPSIPKVREPPHPEVLQTLKRKQKTTRSKKPMTKKPVRKVVKKKVKR